MIREGAIRFARDVEIKLPPKFHANSSTHHVKASSYEGTKSTGVVDVELSDYIKKTIAGKHVLIIDDIYDTGKTLYILHGIVEQLSPLTIEYCVMLEREIEHAYKMQPLFVGHKVTTKDFLVGGGLDLDGELRDLPYIATLKTKVSKWDDEIAEKIPHEIHKTCLCNMCGESCSMAIEHEGPESF
ncbi:MAG: phosphoribosyltransferase, partial [Candidatus Asgardarchaeia archaeon]